MTLKRKLIIIGTGLVIVGGGYWWWQSSRSPEVIPTETVTRGTVSETISVTGELVPAQYADLSFKSIGQLEAIWVKEGEMVKAGDPLSRLDPGSLSDQLKAAQATLSIAEENEKLARRDWDGLKPEERRAKMLASEKARADVATLQTQMAERVLRAPFDGLVTQVPARVGETVSAGETVVRLVGMDAVASGKAVMIEAQIPESDVAKVKVGMVAQVTFDAFTNDEVFEATVKAIETSATIVQDVVSYRATFELVATPDTRLRDGMTANVDIETGHRDHVLILPFRALVRETGDYMVEVQSGETFTKQKVTIGLEGDAGEVEILSGVREGDKVKLSTKSE